MSFPVPTARKCLCPAPLRAPGPGPAQPSGIARGRGYRLGHLRTMVRAHGTYSSDYGWTLTGMRLCALAQIDRARTGSPLSS